MPTGAFNICCPRDCVSGGFKGGTRGVPIMPRDCVSRTANVERNGGHKHVISFSQQNQWKCVSDFQHKITQNCLHFFLLAITC